MDTRARRATFAVLLGLLVLSISFSCTGEETLSLRDLEERGAVVRAPVLADPTLKPTHGEYVCSGDKATCSLKIRVLSVREDGRDDIARVCLETPTSSRCERQTGAAVQKVTPELTAVIDADSDIPPEALVIRGTTGIDPDLHLRPQ